MGVLMLQRTSHGSLSALLVVKSNFRAKRARLNVYKVGAHFISQFKGWGALLHIILGDAGRDSQRHKLVKIRCGHCGQEAVMRADKVARNQSCGCVQRENWKRLVAISRSHKGIKRNFWSKWDDSTEGPSMIVAQAMKESSWYRMPEKRCPHGLWFHRGCTA